LESTGLVPALSVHGRHIWPSDQALRLAFEWPRKLKLRELVSRVG
jgi:hypothetical protein